MPNVDVVNMLAFEERDRDFESKCEFIVPLKTTAKKTVDEIIKKFRSEK